MMNEEDIIAEEIAVSPRRSHHGRNFRKHFARVYRGLGNSPLICLILGVLCLFFAFVCMGVDILTTEYLSMGTSPTIAVSWSVWLQPAQFFGVMTPVETTAHIYAWVVELTQLIFGLVIVVALNKLSEVSRALARWFAIIGFVLILLNGVATYNAAPVANPLVQILIAVVIGGFSVVGFPLGIGLLEQGISEIF